MPRRDPHCNTCHSQMFLFCYCRSKLNAFNKRGKTGAFLVKWGTLIHQSVYVFICILIYLFRTSLHVGSFVGLGIVSFLYTVYVTCYSHFFEYLKKFWAWKDLGIELFHLKRIWVKVTLPKKCMRSFPYYCSYCDSYIKYKKNIQSQTYRN